ncbi:MAG: hypothetical protein D6706_08305 [Chloroflexi bacterium]|nr:MAG: hypothetical protein D6706_08305 [Chloroflexota bacterium]
MKRIANLLIATLLGLLIFGAEGKWLEPSGYDVAQASAIYNTAWLTDAQMEDFSSMSVNDIRSFLSDQGSCLANSINDVDGVSIDVPQLIYNAAQEHRINPRIILATLQKEQSAITQCPVGNSYKLSKLMGVGNTYNAHTARAQIDVGTRLFREYMDELASRGYTRSGWRVGVSKRTSDGVYVVPATRAIAAQFTYTPYAGSNWNGSQGGVYLFYNAWYNQFHFDQVPTVPGSKRIMIEAGHGNGDSGALSCSSPKVKEEDVNLEVAEKVANLLRARGHQVEVVRSWDPRGRRYGIHPSIRGYKGDVYLAIHSDYCAPRVSGYKFARPGGSKPDGLNGSGDASDRLTQSLWDAYGKATGLPRIHNITNAMTHYRSWSYVSSSTPRAIVEMGYLSEDIVALTQRQDDLARGLANGILIFLGEQPGTGDSEDEQVITPGQTINGVINEKADIDTFYVDAHAGDIMSIELNPTTESNLVPYLRLYAPDGKLIAHNDGSTAGKAKIVNTFWHTARYKIEARSNWQASEGAYQLKVYGSSSDDPDDGRWLSYGQSHSGSISNTGDRDVYYFSGVKGRIVTIRMNKSDNSPNLDSFLELWDPNGVKLYDNDDGGGDRNALLVYTLPRSGVYRVMARTYNNASTGNYVISVDAVQNPNLAKGKKAYAPAYKRGYEAYKAVDGNANTRWQSKDGGENFFMLDLGSSQDFDQIVLKWGYTYASIYTISIWNNSNNCWETVWHTSQGDGSQDTANIGHRNARWILLHTQKSQCALGWWCGGYKLWELEVYRNATVLIPTIPPEPGDKPPDTVSDETPLAPTAPGNEIEAITLGVFGDELHENEPITSTTTVIDDAVPPVENIPPIAYINSWTPVVIQNSGVISFTGSGINYDGNSDTITDYLWWSPTIIGTLPISNGLSSQTTLILDSANVSVGDHYIYFQVKNSEGNWSEADEILLTVQEAEKEIFLPIVLR